MRWRFTLNNAMAGTLVLNDEPIGWSDVVMNMKRDPVWHGVFFEYTVNLRFYETGFHYIQDIYNTQGIDAYVSITIDEVCDDGSAFTNFYTGKMVLGKCDFDCQDNCTVSVPVEYAGCLMQFKNRIDQKVDLNANLDFDGNALAQYDRLPFSILLEPKAIVSRGIAVGDCDAGNCNLISDYFSAHTTVNTGTGNATILQTSYLAIPINNVTINEVGLVAGGYQLSDSYNVPQMNATKSGSYFFDVFVCQLKLGFLAGEYGVPSPRGELTGLDIYLIINVNGTDIVSSHVYSATGLSGVTNVLLTNLSVTATWGLNAGDVVRFHFQFNMVGTFPKPLIVPYDVAFSMGGGGSGDCVADDLTVTGKIEAPPSECQVYAINEALSRTVEAITDDCMRVKSDYFGRTDSQPYISSTDGCGSLEVITKGLLIRQFESNMPVSFQDLFNSLNPIHNIGIGIEADAARPGNDVIRIEPMEYFYDSTVVLQCDNIPDVRKTVKMELYPSTIDVGYKTWEAEDSMGLDEFATSRTYRTTLSEVKNNISKVCEFIASGYAIEVTRNKEYVADSTLDWRYDNNIFIICVARDASDLSHLIVEQGILCANTGSMTNIIDPDSIYNYRISPVRNFMRWVKAYMATYFNNINGTNAKFIFTTGDGNFLATGELINGCFQESGPIAENADISLTSFATPADGNPIFKYENDQFDYPLSLAQYQDLLANPRGTIQYRTSNTLAWQEGFISSIQYKPNDGIATFLLLPKYV